MFLVLANSLWTNQGQGKLLDIPFFLQLEGPWIDPQNVNRHFNFGLEVAVDYYRNSHFGNC
jgi:hypothetical protein